METQQVNPMTAQAFFQADPLATSLGIEFLEITSGHAKVRMRIQPHYLNGGGVCHGGIIFTLADLAFAAATNSHARLTLTVEASIRFHRSARQGYLYAEARETLDHRHIASCEVRVTHESGDLIASFAGTGYRKETLLPFGKRE